MQYELPPMRAVAVFEQVDALPGAEGEAIDAAAGFDR